MVNQLSREVDRQYYLCITLRQAITSCLAISPVVATWKLHVIPLPLFFFPSVLHTCWKQLITVCLKNGFLVAVRIFIDRSKNEVQIWNEQKSGTRGEAKFVTDLLSIH